MFQALARLPSKTSCSLLLSSYDPFFNMETNAPGFRGVILKKEDVSALVVSAMENELPFAEINIPASGNVFKAVGIGICMRPFVRPGKE